MSEAQPLGGVASTVTTSDGVRLAVHRSGNPAGPRVLLVHGFPDDHRVWEDVIGALGEHHDVICVDTRGSGGSDRPGRVAAYRLPRLARDLETVIQSTAGGHPVHVVGHDWGSVQAWHLVTTTDLPIASFTSISGPCLDHVPAWVAARLREGPPGWRKVLSMWKSPLYMTALQLPIVTPLLCRLGALDMLVGVVMRGEGAATPAGLRGRGRRNSAALKIYTANLLPRLIRPRPRGTDVPVQVLAPRHDLFVPPAAQLDVDASVRTSRVITIAGGHWAPAFRPGAVAAHVATWIAEHSTPRTDGDPR